MHLHQRFFGPLCEHPAGQLVVYASHGENLRNTDHLRWDGMSDPFLEITAYDILGQKRILRSRVIRDNLNPVWNQTMEFGRRAWKSFTVQVWDDDSDGPWPNNPISSVHRYNLTSFTPMEERQMFQAHRGFVSFNYAYYQGPKNLTLSTYECPRLNGGSCVRESTVCNCTEDFFGPLCEHPAGQLVVYASHGENLRNTDTPGYDGMSDTFLKITAYDILGQKRILRSRVIRDNLNPVWNQTMEFGRRAWKQLAVQVWDDDSGESWPDPMSSVHRYNLTSFTPMVEEKLQAYRGFVSFNYVYYQ